MSLNKLFIENKGQPIFYNGRILTRFDRLSLLKSIANIKLCIISSKSEWIQGIKLNTVGLFNFDGDIIKCKTVKEKIVFWESTMPAHEINFKIESSNNILSVYNVWKYSDNSPTESWQNSAAMFKEEINEEIIYHCNDGHVNGDFSNLIFSLKITYE